MLEEYFDKEEIQILKAIASAANKCAYSAYLIGGVVRDIFLSKRATDVDVIIVGDIYKTLSVLKGNIIFKIVKKSLNLIKR